MERGFWMEPTEGLGWVERHFASTQRKSLLSNVLWQDEETEEEAGELGFEPRLSDPESLVLPLHYSPVIAAQLEVYLTKLRAVMYRRQGYCSGG